MICCKCHSCEGSQVQSWWNIYLENYWLKAKLHWKDSVSSFWGCESGTLPTLLSWLQNPFPWVGTHCSRTRHSHLDVESGFRDLPSLGRWDLEEYHLSLLNFSCSIWQLVALGAEGHHVSPWEVRKAVNSPFSNRDTGGKVCLWDRRALDIGCSVAVSVLGWVSVVQGNPAWCGVKAEVGKPYFFLQGSCVCRKFKRLLLFCSQRQT